MFVQQDYERMNLADALQSRRYKDGECVIQQVPTLITDRVEKR